MEKELEVQIGMKQEMELSMKMLEKDICEKQDALVELRQQLEDLRAINQQLSHKSQVRLCFNTSHMTDYDFWLQHDFYSSGLNCQSASKASAFSWNYAAAF